MCSLQKYKLSNAFVCMLIFLVQVFINHFLYTVETRIETGIEARKALAEYIARHHHLVVCDSSTAKLCLPLMPELHASKRYVLPEGEQYKNLHQCELLLSMMLDAELDRKSILINLGGGTLLDMGGFAASVFKRGISYVNVPTTLLAMADAAIGGKTAVNLQNYRNMIGSFHHPMAVLIIPELLKTLPQEQWLSGCAEIFKHAIIQGESALNRLCNQPVSDWFDEHTLVQQAQFKYDWIKDDPFDRNKRQWLNAGHTTAHAIETVYLNNDQSLLHGFAVAAGLWIESYLAHKLFNTNSDFASRLQSRILEVFPKVNLTAVMQKAMLEAMLFDKKGTNGTRVFSLPVEPGAIKVVEVSQTTQINEAIDAYIHA
jgi:3-dehydroquinate synthase